MTEELEGKLIELQNSLAQNGAQIYDCEGTSGTKKFVEEFAEKEGYAIAKGVRMGNGMRFEMDPKRALIIASCPFDNYANGRVSKELSKDDKPKVRSTRFSKKKYIINKNRLDEGQPFIFVGDFTMDSAKTCFNKNSKNPVWILGKKDNTDLVIPILDFSTGKRSLHFDAYVPVACSIGEEYVRDEDSIPTLHYVDGTGVHDTGITHLELNSPNLAQTLDAATAVTGQPGPNFQGFACPQVAPIPKLDREQSFDATEGFEEMKDNFLSENDFPELTPIPPIPPIPGNSQVSHSHQLFHGAGSAVGASATGELNWLEQCSQDSESALAPAPAPEIEIKPEDWDALSALIADEQTPSPKGRRF